MLEKDFYIKVEQPGYLKRVLYSDTDSIFIKIPEKNIEDKTADELWKKAEHTADKINDLIIDYNKTTLLPRCNISPDNNHTFFKTELLMSAILFLDVKKNYSYKLLVKEGVVLDPPKISYTGIQVVKSDTAKFTQKLLKNIIEDIMLNEKIKNEDKPIKISQIVDEFHEKFKQDINDFEFQDIGIPGKWAKNKQMINGMKIYNKIMNESVFSPASAARFIYCKFGINYGDGINGVCIPYDYDKNLIKEQFQAHKIIIDENKQWNTLITTTCKRVFDLAKKLES